MRFSNHNVYYDTVPRIPMRPIPAVRPVSEAAKFPAKLQVLRAGVHGGRLDVLAQITRRAVGRVRVHYRAAGRTRSFDAPIDNLTGRVRIDSGLSQAQARLGTGIVQITYPGDDRVRSDRVRLRAASGKARLKLQRVQITSGDLAISGTISHHAHGVVRVRVDYVDTDGRLAHLERHAVVRHGYWVTLKHVPLGLERNGGELSLQFTGDLRHHVRGEQISKQVVAPR